MFRKSKKAAQLDVFTNVSSVLDGSASKQYNNNEMWHNQFREQVLSRIDETIFRVLFNEKTGAPNASIRILIGMMILKEGHGWSDAQLYENCRFNLLTRSALGLFNMNDTIPTESTYYLFRQRAYQYNREHGKDLIANSFEQITREQVKEFNVSGRSIRMDSKLIGSNIAFYSRYEIIHKGFQLYYKTLNKKAKALVGLGHQQQIESALEEEPAKTVYRSSKEEIQLQMQKLGALIFSVLTVNPDKNSESYQMLNRLFNEQYKLVNDQVELLPREEITADSIQSPHDLDCSFRNKYNKPVKGYTANITETCDKGSLNLITNVTIENASAIDNLFVVPAIEQTEKLLEHPVDNCHADGAYHSRANVRYCDEHQIQFYLTGMQGTASVYDLIPTAQGLMVINTTTKEQWQAIKTKSNKWRIRDSKGYRYFTEEDIKAYALRKQISQYPPDIRNVRSNVEATIFQVSYHTRNNKTRYRGLIQHAQWASMRCLWINLIRIVNFNKKSLLDQADAKSNSPLMTILTNLYYRFLLAYA